MGTDCKSALSSSRIYPSGQVTLSYFINLSDIKRTIRIKIKIFLDIITPLKFKNLFSFLIKNNVMMLRTKKI